MNAATHRPAPSRHCPERLLPLHRALSRLEDLLDQHQDLPPGTKGALEKLHHELDALADDARGQRLYFGTGGAA